MVVLKWLYDPDEPDQKERATPPCMKGVRVLPRKESTYSPEHIWLQEDHALVLMYRYIAGDRCWHIMVHDTSARQHFESETRLYRANLPHLGHFYLRARLLSRY